MREKFDREIDLNTADDTRRNALITQLESEQNSRISSGLSNKEYHALKLLERCTRSGDTIGPSDRRITDLELKFLQNFLVENMGNMALNKRIKAMNKEEVPGKGHMVGFIRSFTYSTQNINRFMNAAEKLDDLYNSETASSDKLTIQEAGAIARVLDLSGDLGVIRERCPALLVGGYLESFSEGVTSTQQIYKQVEQKIFEEVNFNTGDLMFLDEQQNSKLRGKNYSIEQRILTQLITKHGHVSKISTQRTSNSDNKIEYEHTQGHLTFTGYRAADAFGLKEYLYSHFLKFDVIKTISEEKQQELDKINPNWRSGVRQQYINIQDRIRIGGQGEENYKDMHAKVSIPKKIRIGIAKIFSRDKKKEREDFSKIREKMFEGKYSSTTRGEGKAKTMMCSSFIAREMVASLVELDEFISEQYGVKKAVEVPFDRNIKFGKLLPGRLYDILLEKAVCTAAERSPTERKIFATEEESKNVNQRKTPQEELIKIAEDEIAAYRLDNSPNRQQALRDVLISRVSEVLVKEQNPQAIAIGEKDLEFVQAHVDKLVANSDKRNSKSFIRRWAEQAMDYIGIKSEYNKTIESEVLKIRAIIKNHNIKQVKGNAAPVNTLGVRDTQERAK